MQKYVIALYIRLSIEDYKYDSMSIENQRLVLNEYAAAMPEGLNSEVLEFVDNGYSGTNFERPQVQKLIEMVRENRIDCIIVKDFSRFGRNSIETGYFLERVFPLFHTRFISVSDDYDSDNYKGDTGGMDVAFKYLISEYYSRDTEKGWVHVLHAKNDNERFVPMAESLNLRCKVYISTVHKGHSPDYPFFFKHFTEDLLLSSMETAGAKDMPEDAERKGLGTPATRAGILEKLVSTGMLERRKVKKQTILVPTALGNSLITVLPEQLQSPLLTAEWEHRLSQVQKGELEPEEFLADIQGMLTDLVADYRPVSGADILFPSAENTVGKCPRCGRPVIERSKGYFCTGQDCKFVLWRDSRFFTLKQKTLDKRTAQLLLEKGRAPLKGCVSSKTGNVYDAAVVLEDDGERAHFKLVFGNG